MEGFGDNTGNNTCIESGEMMMSGAVDLEEVIGDWVSCGCMQLIECSTCIELSKKGNEYPLQQQNATNFVHYARENLT
ncbi:hypothetical protein QJS10_CPA16g00202 [Acorus calamus]|uniref:Uncharacterized protein n=1 Tax=Acorus calamus TaxID=4465 RepID=A0AAV9CZG4_ACOCL|nr:hypothetical protein QJS10_CPA16g00202 [Acorus calamus]